METAMAPNMRSLFLGLLRLQTIHADLLRKKAALESLRKQVQRKEAEREAKNAYVGQRTKKPPKARRDFRTDVPSSSFRQ
jgi:hypothetical protein